MILKAKTWILFDLSCSSNCLKMELENTTILRNWCQCSEVNFFFFCDLFLWRTFLKLVGAQHLHWLHFHLRLMITHEKKAKCPENWRSHHRFANSVHTNSHWYFSVSSQGTSQPWQRWLYTPGPWKFYQVEEEIFFAFSQTRLGVSTSKWDDKKKKSSLTLNQIWCSANLSTQNYIKFGSKYTTHFNTNFPKKLFFLFTSPLDSCLRKLTSPLRLSDNTFFSIQQIYVLLLKLRQFINISNWTPGLYKQVCQ